MLRSNVRFTSESGMCNAVADVRFGSKADMCSAQAHVRFTPNSDIDCVVRHLCAKSGNGDLHDGAVCGGS
jgi:hypothetical protein